MSSKEDSSTHEDSSSDSDLTAAFNATAANRLVDEKRCSTAQKDQQQQQQQEEEDQQEEQEEQEQQEQEEQQEQQQQQEQQDEEEQREVETPAPESPAVGAPESPAKSPPTPRRKQAHPLSRVDRLNREIRLLQNSNCFMIPRLPFGRLVREFIQKHSPSTTCITRGALEALQTATEMFLTQRFQDSYLMTMHRGRVTLEVRDMALMAAICKLHGQL